MQNQCYLNVRSKCILNAFRIRKDQFAQRVPAKIQDVQQGLCFMKNTENGNKSKFLRYCYELIFITCVCDMPNDVWGYKLCHAQMRAQAKRQTWLIRGYSLKLLGPQLIIV